MEGRASDPRELEMPTSILMPSLSPTMEEGVLAKWLVKEGDFIKPGTMLCSVETDKTTVDYESLDEGYLRKILVPGGSPAKVNQLIAILTDEKDEDFQDYLDKAVKKNQETLAKSGKSAPAPAAQAASPAPAMAVQAMSNGAPHAVAAPAAASGTSVATMEAPAAHAGAESRVKVSPLARKMAEEAGIPLQNLTGSGPMGRIVKRDVESYVPPAPAAAPAAPAAGKAPSGPVQRPLYGSLAPVAQTQDIPLNAMRKTIGRRLLESSQSMPVFFVTMKIEMDALNALRDQLNRAPGYKVSVNDLVVKATAFALRQLPDVNSSFHGEFIRKNSNIDICVAVSVENGLITPIVRNVDQKGLGQISSEIKSLVAKAKAGKLAPEEYQGGTFTISNLGMYGVDEFTAIINPPQAAILAVGGIQTELYKDGDAIKERSVMKVTLSSDHRVIDGALAAQFVSALKSILENPVTLML
jgi:pyruvate dehydrogenase E2 component (dihydrolipoamide acetyltransferase)